MLATVWGGAGCLRHYQCQRTVRRQMLLQHRCQLPAEDAVQRPLFLWDLEGTPRLLRVWMLDHSSPYLASARKISGFETAGYFLSKQPPNPFQPQAVFSGCWSRMLGLGQHCHYLPQRAGLLPSDTAAPLPFTPQAVAVPTCWDELWTSVGSGI